MGRSQVAYNKAHGRPGGKGRGGGGQGRGASRRTKPPVVVGDNSWRYREQETTTAVSHDFFTSNDNHDLHVMSGGFHSMPLDQRETWVETTNLPTWDLVTMSKVLQSLAPQERLQIPIHLTESLGSVAIPTGSSQAKQKSVTGRTDKIYRENQQEQTKTQETKEPIKPTLEKDETTNDREEKGGKEEDDNDMEAWLDSVIS